MEDIWVIELRDNINQIKDEIIFWRRDFHQFPELGMNEWRTSQKIKDFLESENIPYMTCAQTGIVGMIQGVPGGKTVALRADMDALPIEELNQVPYKSNNPGIMHACGHDAHTAILMGVAKVLNQHKQNFQGVIKLFFQPAEETVGGAKYMIEEGCMDKPKVDYVLGLHVFPRIETGKVEFTYGKMNASTDGVTINVYGKSGHGAYPHDGTDAIVIAGQIISGLQAMIARCKSPFEPIVLTIGKIEGGTKGNIISDKVVMTGTLRTLDQNQREMIKHKAQSIVEHIGLAFGTKAEIIFDEGYIPLVNNDKMVDFAKKQVESLLGEKNVEVAKQGSMGAEDFGYFLQHAPGIFYNLGCGNEDKGIVYKGHHPLFDIDEECLVYGVLLQSQLTLKLLEEKPEFC